MQGKGYGRRNITEVIIMKELDSQGKKDHIKKLWQENPEKYYEWKNWCIQLNRLPDFFGTRDNPKEIDESKL
jgi:hypothetical protein